MTRRKSTALRTASPAPGPPEARRQVHSMPLRRPGAGSAHPRPAAHAVIRNRAGDRVTGVGIRVVSHVRTGPRARLLHAALVRWLGFIPADAAGAAAPRGFAAVASAGAAQAQ